MDGNIQASAAALYHLLTLVTKYGKDRQITECLDTRAFYIVPRVNPDGTEWALANAIRKLASDPKQSHAMGLKGRKYLEENFSRQTIGEKLVRLLKGISKSVNSSN